MFWIKPAARFVPLMALLLSAFLATAQAAAPAPSCASAKLGVATVAASAAQDGNPAQHVLDGSLDTRWSGHGKGTYITADLGSPKQVCGVSVAWFNGNLRTNQFALSLSNDGVNFSSVFSGTSLQNLALQPYAVTPRTARYVRVTVNGNTVNDWASITELQVNGGGTAAMSRAQASRFLGQAAFGATAEDIQHLQSIGINAWIDEQFAMPRSTPSRVDWLYAKGYDDPTNQFSDKGADNVVWGKLIASPDTLRQRVVLALSEIFVVAQTGFGNTRYRSFALAGFQDGLEANAFGNVRSILSHVSTSPAMGSYLSFIGNQKANPVTGSEPDENYAREIMQLFTIGLLDLNLDGTPVLQNGVPRETYDQDDVTGLARVFTGWTHDTSVGTIRTPDRDYRPMVQIASRHELGEKRFLGTVIPAGTNGENSLKLALDTLFAHPNIGPFLSRQLIQRLVTSNPSPAYVARVAGKFNNNGAGVKGDLKAVIRAILTDTEARSSAGLTSPTYGKLREPMLRFLQWAHTFKATSPSPDGDWYIGNLSDPATRLAQSPGRSPSVFNFFRPGYVPPNTAIGAQGLQAPEFQITSESSAVGYANFMQSVIGSGWHSLHGDYTKLLAIANDSAALLAEINVLLAAGQVSATTLASMKTSLDTISVSTAQGRTNRVNAALTLVMCSPEYLVQK